MNYKELNDYELLNLALDNEEAREVIFEKYKPLIYKIASKFYKFNKCRGTELSDVIQEGNIGLNHAINHYNEQKDNLFFTYAKVCIETSIISYYVRMRRQKNKLLNESLSMDAIEEIDEVNGLDKIVKDSSLDPINIIVTTEKSDYIHEKLKDKLTDFEQMVLDLREYGCDYKEIATLLDRDVKAVDNAVQRIRSKARKIEKGV